MKKIFRHQKVLGLSGVMVIITFLIACVSILLLYNNARNDIKNRLTDIVQREKAFTLSLLADTEHTENKIVEHFKIKNALGQYGEVTIAKVINDSIEFLISNASIEKNLKISKNIPDIVPMRMALNNKNGFLKGPDYKGIEVYAAYTYVEELKWGIVAKIPTSEINKPYYTAIIIVFILALILISISSFILFKTANPIIDQLQKNEKELIKAKEKAEVSERKYSVLIDTTQTGYLVLNSKGCVVDANQEYIRLTSYEKLEQIVGQNVIEWTAPYDIEKTQMRLNNV